MKKIELTQGRFALVDDEDFDLLSKRKWYAQKSKQVYYAYCGNSTAMHRVIMNPPAGMVVDHIDSNGLNNQKSNLRICTKAENNRHKRIIKKPNKTGFRGVSKHNVGPGWVAQVGGKNIGYFKSPEEAAMAYDEKAKEMFGDFAVTNF